VLIVPVRSKIRTVMYPHRRRHQVSGTFGIGRFVLPEDFFLYSAGKAHQQDDLQRQAHKKADHPECPLPAAEIYSPPYPRDGLWNPGPAVFLAEVETDRPVVGVVPFSLVDFFPVFFLIHFAPPSLDMTFSGSGTFPALWGHRGLSVFRKEYGLRRGM